MTDQKFIFNDIYREVINNYKQNSDFQSKEFIISGKYPSLLVFLDGSVDSEGLSKEVVKPLSEQSINYEDKEEITQTVSKYLFSLSVDVCDDKDTAVKKLAFGNALLFIDRCKTALIIEAMPKNTRAVSEPTSENVTKGSKDCFTERAKVNLSLIRSRLINPDLQIERTVVGKQSSTSIYFASINGIVNPDCLKTAHERIEKLDIDCVSSLGVLEEALRDNNSLFPQTLSTERPDRACAHLNEGCIVIIADGFPFVLIAPVSIVHHMSTADDYSRHYVAASLIRIMRYFLLINALILPGFYVAVATFHQEMLPSKLAASIIRTRMSVPFNDYIEVVVLLFAFEVLAEAGLRMPQNIGQTVSIVGGLIVGDAAVNAKIISPIVVIVVALSMVATYTIPDQDLSNAVRICRFILCFFCYILGLAGLTFGIIGIVTSLCSNRSLNVPYMSPLLRTSPPTRDALIRNKFENNTIRPQFLGTENGIRRKNK